MLDLDGEQESDVAELQEAEEEIPVAGETAETESEETVNTEV